jgi:hypothetical protein
MLSPNNREQSFPGILTRPDRQACRDLPALCKLVSKSQGAPEPPNAVSGRQVRGLSHFIYDLIFNVLAAGHYMKNFI